ncbi:hypothetical protein PR048_010337 [Dryococelus australis]|uniref:Uncharacterized protein n=1 Tax=Dryococelus australis TaxID=614101 RepID=A0ABQ9I4F2_9NEOP|nr:hypothetical protein PR048_010337 [Dryococelus australis]
MTAYDPINTAAVQRPAVLVEALRLGLTRHVEFSIHMPSLKAECGNRDIGEEDRRRREITRRRRTRCLYGVNAQEGVEPADLARPRVSSRCASHLPVPPGTAVAERLDCSPPTNKASWLQSLAGSRLDFRKWEPCRTMPLLGGFSRGSPVFVVLSFRYSSILTSFHPHRFSRADCFESNENLVQRIHSRSNLLTQLNSTPVSPSSPGRLLGFPAERVCSCRWGGCPGGRTCPPASLPRGWAWLRRSTFPSGGPLRQPSQSPPPPFNARTQEQRHREAMDLIMLFAASSVVAGDGPRPLQPRTTRRRVTLVRREGRAGDWFTHATSSSSMTQAGVAIARRGSPTRRQGTLYSFSLPLKEWDGPAQLIYTPLRHHGNTARLARRSDEALARECSCHSYRSRFSTLEQRSGQLHIRTSLTPLCPASDHHVVLPTSEEKWLRIAAKKHDEIPYGISFSVDSTPTVSAQHVQVRITPFGKREGRFCHQRDFVCLCIYNVTELTAEGSRREAWIWNEYNEASLNGKRNKMLRYFVLDDEGGLTIVCRIRQSSVRLSLIRLFSRLLVESDSQQSVVRQSFCTTKSQRDNCPPRKGEGNPDRKGAARRLATRCACANPNAERVSSVRARRAASARAPAT